MSRFALIADGLVVEMIDIPADGPPIADRYHPDLVASMVPAGGDVAAGWTWNGKKFSPPVPPVPAVPSSITRRQLLLALAGAGMISGEEALAAATTGAVPARIDKVFGALSDTDALAARITWATMSVVERGHPLIGALIAAEVTTAAEVDALFTSAATL